MLIKNKEFKEKQIGKNYVSVILQGLRSAGAQGMTVGMMKESHELIDKLQKNSDDSEIEVTPKELKLIIERTQAIPWLVYNEEIMALDTHLLSL